MLQTYVSSISDVSEVCSKCFHIDVAKVDQDIAHVAKCFICFRYMLQMFYLDVAKVVLDVAYICMLQAYVSSVSYICFIYFIWMMHMFVMATHVFASLSGVLQVFLTYVASVLLFRTYVLSVFI
jgi:hypothetical protein